MMTNWGGSKNNIGLIRFILASMVVIVHVHDLSQGAGLAIINRIFSANLAVQGFFVLSGFLVLASYDRSSSLRSYLEKRFRRVYPAYFTVIVGSAICLSLLSSLSFFDYFGRPFWAYLLPNLAFANFIHPSVADVFANNPKNPAVNGALWTLKLEVVFYLMVPLIALAGRWVARNWIIAALFIVSVLFTYAVDKFGGGRDIAKQLPGQMTYFCIGMAFHQNIEKIRFSALPAFAVGLVLFFASNFLLTEVLRPVAVGAMVLAAAYAPYLGNFERHGDFSYGLYILHFPIVQTLISETSLPQQPIVLLLTSYGITLVGAVVLWNLVERRFLKRGSHYRKEEHASAAPPISSESDDGAGQAVRG